ncbi:MAG: methyltransferase domain-containing protein [Candidatus Thorarchaeota archaeon]|nr:methyltransferase domain-containing protein [Candidatus Thorarchaeota archaeon]
MTGTKKVSEMSSAEIKEAVRKSYERAAQSTRDDCCSASASETERNHGTSSCCNPESAELNSRTNHVEELGYEVVKMPDSGTESFTEYANPVAIADLKEGEVVLDLGSGAGLDMFHAARKVGSTGRVVGVDMTQAMIDNARDGAEKLGLDNVEFRLGDIEEIPVEDESIDVIISNCVINLAPNKAKVFQEAFRVLRPGGRMMVSDMILETELSEDIRQDISCYAGCIAGAILEEEYLQHIRNAGFVDVEIVDKVAWKQAFNTRIVAYKPKSGNN